MEMEAIREHRARPGEHAMHGPRESRADRLHAAGEIARGRGLDDQVHVVALDRVVNDSKSRSVDRRRAARVWTHFANEAELRAIWSAPETRKKLLQGLAEKGFGGAQLTEMQKIIDAEKSDLFDVLAHVAYALAPLTREQRAARAKVQITSHFDAKQQAFLDFVLSHYVSVGVEELDQEKLKPLLRLRYRDSIADAIADLGDADEIGQMFAGFQKYLYEERAAA